MWLSESYSFLFSCKVWGTWRSVAVQGVYLKRCEIIVQKRTWAEEDAGKEISISLLGDASDCTSKEVDAPAGDCGLRMCI